MDNVRIKSFRSKINIEFYMLRSFIICGSVGRILKISLNE